jgi:hypothetical protein
MNQANTKIYVRCHILVLCLLECTAVVLPQPQLPAYKEASELYHGLYVSCVLPDTVLIVGESVKMQVRIQNRGKDTLLLCNESPDSISRWPGISLERGAIDFSWMSYDLRPEYGLPSLQLLPPGSMKVMILTVVAPKIDTEDAQFSVRLWLGFLRSDPILTSLIDVPGKSHFIPESQWARLVSLQEKIGVGPLQLVVKRSQD